MAQSIDIDDNPTDKEDEIFDTASKFQPIDYKETLKLLETTIMDFLSKDENVRRLGVDSEFTEKIVKELLSRCELIDICSDQNELNAKKELERANNNGNFDDDDEFRDVPDRTIIEIIKLRKENRVLKEKVTKLNFEIATLQKLAGPAMILVELAEELFTDDTNPEKVAVRGELVEKLTDFITSFLRSTVSERTMKNLI